MGGSVAKGYVGYSSFKLKTYRKKEMSESLALASMYEKSNDRSKFPSFVSAYSDGQKALVYVCMYVLIFCQRGIVWPNHSPSDKRPVPGNGTFQKQGRYYFHLHT